MTTGDIETTWRHQFAGESSERGRRKEGRKEGETERERTRNGFARRAAVVVIAVARRPLNTDTKKRGAEEEYWITRTSDR